MRLASAFFAENFEASSDGRIHVFGGCFDHIAVPHIPTEITLRLFVRCEFDESEKGAQSVLAFTVINPDGTPRPRKTPPLVVNVPDSTPGMPSFANALIHLQLTIENPGIHKLRFFDRDREIGELSLYVDNPKPKEPASD
jgi:hypothetical protein